MNNNTIAAIATPRGMGGIGVIRISGEKAKNIADKIFVSASGKSLEETPGYTARYGKIVENDQILDDVIALVFTAPNSYTGEDVVEVSCHGGLYITQKVLRAILNSGAAPAEPGEFTKRAFLNGKIDLTQAEFIMDLISANGEQAAKAAALGKEGVIYKRITNVKNELINLAAHLSAWADYPEDDIPQISEESIKETLQKSMNELEKLLQNYDAGVILKEGLNTVIVGRPNVGKSTLMNLLSGCEKSIVTDIAGTTRDVVEETIMLGDVMLRLADTAGIRNTEDKVEKIGVDKAKEKIKTSKLVLAVFDGTSGLLEDDLKILNSLNPNNSIAVINKADLGLNMNLEPIKEKVTAIVELSAKSGEGLENLSRIIYDLVGFSKLEDGEGILSNERQRKAVMNAEKAINEALDTLRLGMTLDAVTVSIEEAIQELLELTGDRASEVVVNEVFSQFCVGK